MENSSHGRRESAVAMWDIRYEHGYLDVKMDTIQDPGMIRLGK